MPVCIGLSGLSHPYLRGNLCCADSEHCHFRRCHWLNLEHCRLYRPALFQPVQNQLRDKICPRRTLRRYFLGSVYLSSPRLDEGQIQNRIQPDEAAAALLRFGGTDRSAAFLFTPGKRRQHGGHPRHDGSDAARLFPRNVREKRSADGKAAVALSSGAVPAPEDSTVQDQQLLCNSDERRRSP